MFWNLLKYEIRNILGNFFIPLFGIVLPIFMGIVIPYGVLAQVPDAFKDTVRTAIILSMAIIIPMCVGFIGYGASYSQEIEKNIPQRLKLFGISNRDYLISKILGQLAVVTISFAVYFATMFIVHGIKFATLQGTLIYFAFHYIFTIAFIMMSHAIAELIGKFSATYGVLMTLYFFMMFISGSMGLRYEDFPDFLKTIADIFPLSFFGNESVNIWNNTLQHYGPLIQSTLTLLVIAILLVWLSRLKGHKLA